MPSGLFVSESKLYSVQIEDYCDRQSVRIDKKHGQKIFTGSAVTACQGVMRFSRITTSYWIPSAKIIYTLSFMGQTLRQSANEKKSFQSTAFTVNIM